MSPISYNPFNWFTAKSTLESAPAPRRHYGLTTQPLTLATTRPVDEHAILIVDKLQKSATEDKSLAASLLKQYDREILALCRDPANQYENPTELTNGIERLNNATDRDPVNQHRIPPELSNRINFLNIEADTEIKQRVINIARDRRSHIIKASLLAKAGTLGALPLCLDAYYVLKGSEMAGFMGRLAGSTGETGAAVLTLLGAGLAVRSAYAAHNAGSAARALARVDVCEGLA